MTTFAEKNIHVVGVSGAEGAAIALYFANKEGISLTLHDISENDQFEKTFGRFHDAYTKDEQKEKIDIILKQANLHFKESYLQDIEQADIIFAPQSWFRYEENSKLNDHKEKIKNIIWLYFKIASCKIVGVTGSTGKSTTSAMVAEICKKAGKKTILSGNERNAKQEIQEIESLSAEDVLVLEISHRQLMIDLEKSPDVSIITNVQQNHKDDYDSFEEYVAIKESIAKHITENNKLLVETSYQIASKEIPEKYIYRASTEELLNSGVFLRFNNIVVKTEDSERIICDARDLSMQGEHNLKNMLFASMAAFLLGIKPKEIRHALIDFRPLKSRFEKIAEINNVEIIDDSKSSSPDATIAAVAAVRKPTHLILGGSRKKLEENEFDELAKMVLEKKMKTVHVIGEVKDVIEEALHRMQQEDDVSVVQIFTHKTLQEAVQGAWKFAKPGEILLFSPACESFGQYKDYRERTKDFRNIVKTLQ